MHDALSYFFCARLGFGCSAAGGMQGARKDGKTPDGQSYLAVAESAAIKALLQA